MGPKTDGVPLLVVRAESHVDECSARSVGVEATVSINEPAVWVRDPSRRGMIVVWKRTYRATVPRGDAARRIERAVLDGLNVFVAAQDGADDSQ